MPKASAAFLRGLARHMKNAELTAKPDLLAKRLDFSVSDKGLACQDFRSM